MGCERSTGRLMESDGGGGRQWYREWVGGQNTTTRAAAATVQQKSCVDWQSIICLPGLQPRPNPLPQCASPTLVVLSRNGNGALPPGPKGNQATPQRFSLIIEADNSGQLSSTRLDRLHQISLAFLCRHRHLLAFIIASPLHTCMRTASMMP